MTLSSIRFSGLVLMAALSCAASDRFEPNDYIAIAADLGTLGNRTETNLTIHTPRNNDYYKLTAAADGTLDVSILFSHAVGDLNLVLYDAELDWLGSSLSTTDNEQLSHAVQQGSNYWIWVIDNSGATNEYDLVIEGPVSGSDRFEPNDSFEEARNLGTLGNRTETNLTIHTSGNDDYYMLTADGNGTLDVSILFSHAVGDLNLALLDAAGNVLTYALSTNDNEQLSYTVQQGSNYWIWVHDQSGAENVYDLVIEGLPDRFEPNDSFAAAWDLGTLGSRTETNLTIHTPGNDDYYKLTTSSEGTLGVSILFSHAVGDLNLALLDAAGNVLTYALSTTDNEQLSYAVQQGSNYWIRVIDHSGAANVYDLVIEGVLDRFEPNDSFATAWDLGTLVSRMETNLTIHTPGDSDLYKLTASADGTLGVSILFSHTVGDLDLRLADAPWSWLGISQSTNDYEQLSCAVQQGSNYWIWVIDHSGAANVYDMIIINYPSHIPINLVPEADNRVVFKWPSIAGITYGIETATNLLSGFDITVSNGIAATPPTNTCTLTVDPDLSSLFFRLIQE